MLDKLTLLYRFQVISDAGNMRRAAAKLGVTQPALSRSLAQLEKHFGQKLVERHARGVVPTRFGEDVLRVASRIARDWEIAEGQLLEESDTTRGVFRVSAGPLWRAVVLPEVLSKLQARFPKLEIELRNSTVGETARLVTEGKIDVALSGLQSAETQTNGLEHRVFTQVRDCVVARENHPIFEMADKKGRISVQALLKFPWLVYTADQTYLDETMHAVLERTGKPPEIRLYSESLISALRILQCSDTLCMLPDAAVAETADPAIVPVPVNLGRRTSDSGAFYRSSMRDWAPLATLLDLCERHFQLSS